MINYNYNVGTKIYFINLKPLLLKSGTFINNTTKLFIYIIYSLTIYL